MSAASRVPTPRALGRLSTTAVLLALGLVTASSALADDNAELEDTINILLGLHNFALPLSLFPEPVVG
ncbi:MAG: hypothetical protein V2J42_08605, partial [Wenzhouxiangella sp.]|nr:hypothetical protein [Wenzhouxiangella sp.]